MNRDASKNKTKPWVELDVAGLEGELKKFLMNHGWKEETMVMPSEDISYYRSPVTGHLHPLSFAVGCVFREYGIKA